MPSDAIALSLCTRGLQPDMWKDSGSFMCGENRCTLVICGKIQGQPVMGCEGRICGRIQGAFWRPRNPWAPALRYVECLKALMVGGLKALGGYLGIWRYVDRFRVRRDFRPTAGNCLMQGGAAAGILIPVQPGFF